MALISFKFIRKGHVGGVLENQDICYIMGTEIFKIEEEITDKIKPEVANPPSKNGQNSLLSIYID